MQRPCANLVDSARNKSLSWFGIITLGLMCLGSAPASDKEALWKTYMDAGEKAYNQDRNQTAGIMLAAALVEAENFGPDDPRVASTLEKLADVLLDQERYSDAEPLYERALAIQEKRLGPGHEDLATLRRNLVDCYLKQGGQRKADQLYEKAIALLEKQPDAGAKTLPKLLREAVVYLLPTGQAERSAWFARPGNRGSREAGGFGGVGYRLGKYGSCLLRTRRVR